LELELPRAQGEVKAALEKHIKGWRESLARYESEPETKEGRKELAERAKAVHLDPRMLDGTHVYIRADTGFLPIEFQIRRIVGNPLQFPGIARSGMHWPRVRTMNNQ
jgi:hypothetical protein